MRQRVRKAALAAVALAAAVLAATAGCARRDVLLGRLRGIPDDAARRALSDCLWAGGSVHRWATHSTVRLAVARTEHRPAGDVTGDEVWLLDPEGGRLRIEKPAARQVTLFDGAAWRVFVEGNESRDPELRSLAAGEGQLARQFALAPFSLLESGQKVTYVGARTGPGETRAWDRLLVTYGPGSGFADADRTVVEINQASHRADAAMTCWSACPFLGGCWRVDLLDWRAIDGLSLSRRWRLVPINEAGAPTGPARWSVEVKNVTFDVPAGGATFSRP